MADQLAKKAVMNTGQTVQLPTSNMEIKKRIKAIFRDEWQTRWNRSEYNTAKRFFERVPERETGGWGRGHRGGMGASRRDWGMLLQVVSGHGLFGSHLKKWNPSIDVTCQCCFEEDETSWHLWGGVCST